MLHGLGIVPLLFFFVFSFCIQRIAFRLQLQMKGIPKCNANYRWVVCRHTESHSTFQHRKSRLPTTYLKREINQPIQPIPTKTGNDGDDDDVHVYQWHIAQRNDQNEKKMWNWNQFVLHYGKQDHLVASAVLVVAVSFKANINSMKVFSIVVVAIKIIIF